MENISFNEIFNLLAVLAMAAAVAGFMAGLLGVGEVLLWFLLYIMRFLF